MKKNWKVKTVKKDKKINNKKRLFPELEKITENILLGKGIDSQVKKEEFLYPDYETHIYDANLLSDINLAVDRILKAKKREELICIYGDYDVDGITSATILYDFFQQISIKSFTYLPDRNKEGYGLNNKAIDYIVNKKANLIITVDCGIASFKEVEYAKKKNIEVIITDHHFVPKKIPRALAVINPKKKDDKYPEKMLAGVGVTFKVIQAIAQKIKDYNLEQLKWLLDLVAVGNVADCVSLLGENRTLTKFGLMVLAKTQRVGLKQLFQVGNIKINSTQLPTGEQIGFQIAPRINAAGRMDHASLAYELLITSSKQNKEARLLALEIEDQNKKRQKVTEEIIKEIIDRIDENNIPNVIVYWSSHWQLGLVGLVAGKIAERFNRPTIIFHRKNKTLKGSCRSVPQFNLMDNFDRINYLLEHYGGHAQAAGVTILKQNFIKFREAINQLAKNSALDKVDKKIIIDKKIKIEQINYKLLKELLLMEPFGKGNKKPVFLSEKVVLQKIVFLGNCKQHLKIWVSDFEKQKQTLELIVFNYKNYLDVKDSDLLKLTMGRNIDIVYSLENNVWNGQNNIQGRLMDLKINN